MSLLEYIMKTESLGISDLIKKEAKKINSQVKKKEISTKTINKIKKQYKPTLKRRELDEETSDFVYAIIGVGTAYIIHKIAEYVQ